ncbi:MAG: imidazole glycerol phosphate synthase subunit HisH [Bacteroidota bacterium]|nr:imidazole glycerol phosphate synthase subunit HisH [Bacteroidota bacterium]
MSSKVVIVDYGLGNIFSINQACKHVGLDSTITSDPKHILNADALILPGVGAFGDAMNSLRENNLIEPILDFVKTGKPFLGICLGMQLLFTESEEFGEHKGLNLVPGKIVRFPEFNSNSKVVRVPQIQWNQIYKNDPLVWNSSPLIDIEEGTYMHFVHSYYAIPQSNDNILSYSEYEGVRYASAVAKDNIVGVQFHPEKSADQGLKIYRNWSNYIKNKVYRLC